MNRALEARKSFLEGLAEALAEASNFTAERELRNLINQEEQREKARRLKRVSIKPLQSAMTHLMARVQQPDSTIKEIELMQQDKQEQAALKE